MPHLLPGADGGRGGTRRKARHKTALPNTLSGYWTVHSDGQREADMRRGAVYNMYSNVYKGPQTPMGSSMSGSQRDAPKTPHSDR